jgi:uncharacterized membrane protein YgdD (TMEM256/DUF423 family)
LQDRIFLAVASITGALSVAGDAAARHMIAADPYRFELAGTATHYGLIHAVALLGIVLLTRGAETTRWPSIAGGLFVAGIVLFCGSLGLIAAGAAHGLAMFAPWGGTAFILGWIALLPLAFRR